MDLSDWFVDRQVRLLHASTVHFRRVTFDFGCSMESSLSARSLDSKTENKIHKRERRNWNNQTRYQYPNNRAMALPIRILPTFSRFLFPAPVQVLDVGVTDDGATSRLYGQKIKYWSLRPFRLDDHPR